MVQEKKLFSQRASELKHFWGSSRHDVSSGAGVGGGVEPRSGREKQTSLATGEGEGEEATEASKTCDEVGRGGRGVGRNSEH